MTNAQSFTVTPQTEDTLDRAIGIISSRKEMFDGALVAFVFENCEDDTQKVCYGLITFLSSNMDKPKPLHYEYEKLVIVRHLMSIEDSIEFLKKMYLQSIIELPELQPINFNGSLHRTEYSESRYGYGYAFTDWPSVYVSGRIENRTQGILTQEPLVSLKHPLFPNGVEALKTSLDLRFIEDAYTIHPNVEIIIPDYRARITGIVIDGSRVSLDVQTGSEKNEEMIVKFFSRGQYRTQSSGNLPLSSNRIELELNEEPLIIEVHLLSSNDGSTIDSISYNYRYSRTKIGVTLKDEQVLLLDLISRGENQTVEFKKELNKGNVSELIESVVSFANTAGGRILLGVGDNGEITGITEANIEDRINSWITEYCDPPINMEYRPTPLQEYNIGIIYVPEGENKPYILKDKGPYVRRGSTDRSAKRSEIDEFYQKKKGINF